MDLFSPARCGREVDQFNIDGRDLFVVLVVVAVGVVYHNAELRGESPCVEDSVPAEFLRGGFSFTQSKESAFVAQCIADPVVSYNGVLYESSVFLIRIPLAFVAIAIPSFAFASIPVRI